MLNDLVFCSFYNVIHVRYMSSSVSQSSVVCL